MSRIPAEVKRRTVARAGGRCAFPDCPLDLVPDGLFLGHICHIEAPSAGGPRHSPSGGPPSHEDNLILLCPTHHALVDTSPERYTADWLRTAKERHESYVAERLGVLQLHGPTIDPSKAVPFANAFRVWQDNRTNSDEEFWHRLFKANPALLAVAFPDCVVMFDDKCYVGGKDLSNSGGNIVDFLLAGQITRHIILVEIKTPQCELVGSRYRSNAFAIAQDLTGAIVQVLAYRDSLLKNWHTIAANMPASLIAAVSPRCVVLAGEIEPLSAAQRQSLDLFRTALTMVHVLSYDELFGKVQDLCDVAGIK